MGKSFCFTVVYLLTAGLCLAQEVNEKAPASLFERSAIKKPMLSNRGLGDTLWFMNVEAATGDNRILGCEFDGTNYWFTGAGYFDGTNEDPQDYLYEVTPGGILVNTYVQPGNDNSWGWRDLAWDGTYLYGGDDQAHPGYITQIDPITGSPTGTHYGPYPIIPCRALAYDPEEDCFWSADFSSSIYKCYRNGGYISFYYTPLDSIYGAAMVDDRVWFWAQDGNGLMAGEFDPAVGGFTGNFFDGDQSVGNGGIAGGAAAYDRGDYWEFIGQGQGDPDMMVAYEIPHYPNAPLEIAPDTIKGIDGGDILFTLTGGPAQAGKDFLILGTASGTSPGIDLPGGGNLPINWDNYTQIILNQTLNGNPNFPLYGSLDGDGNAVVTMTLPAKVRYFDLLLHFAYLTETFDWASNAVPLFVEGEKEPLPEYYYDDGSTEDSISMVSGGQIGWLQWFNTVPGQDTITHIKTAWGTPGSFNMPDGTPAFVYLWDDPTNDGDPSDCVLLASAPTTVQQVGTDTFTEVDIPDTIVSGVFFVGASADQRPAYHIVPIDLPLSPTTGEAWVVGDKAGLDAANLMNNDITPLKLATIGYDGYLLVRAPFL